MARRAGNRRLVLRLASDGGRLVPDPGARDRRQPEYHRHYALRGHRRRDRGGPPRHLQPVRSGYADYADVTDRRPAGRARHEIPCRPGRRDHRASLLPRLGRHGRHGRARGPSVARRRSAARDGHLQLGARGIRLAGRDPLEPGRDPRRNRIRRVLPDGRQLCRHERFLRPRERGGLRRRRRRRLHRPVRSGERAAERRRHRRGRQRRLCLRLRRRAAHQHLSGHQLLGRCQLRSVRGAEHRADDHLGQLQHSREPDGGRHGHGDRSRRRCDRLFHRRRRGRRPLRHQCDHRRPEFSRAAGFRGAGRLRHEQHIRCDHTRDRRSRSERRSGDPGRSHGCAGSPRRPS